MGWQLKPAIISPVGDFLQHRKQCIKFSRITSEYINCIIGTPLGTKIGPILQLIYSNDLQIDGLEHIIKYADDTTVFTTVDNASNHSAIIPAVNATKAWL